MARESIPDLSATKCKAILVIIGAILRQLKVRIWLMNESMDSWMDGSMLGELVGRCVDGWMDG